MGSAVGVEELRSGGLGLEGWDRECWGGGVGVGVVGLGSGGLVELGLGSGVWGGGFGVGRVVILASNRPRVKSSSRQIVFASSRPR